MKIDSGRVRAERERRAWSQEHLAAAAGMGVRTIQRIESAGVASFESGRALAAVFELTVEQLRASAPPALPRLSAARSWRRGAAVAGALALVTAVTLLSVRTVTAAQVRLDVGLTLDDQKLIDSQLVSASGQESELTISAQLTARIVSTRQPDGTVSIQVRLFEFNGIDYVLGSAPRVLTTDEVTAHLTTTTAQGHRYQLDLTPHEFHGTGQRSTTL